MAAVRMLAGVELRRRWRQVVVLTLLVGFAGAVVLALVAGARRTSTALDRFERETATSDLEIAVGEASREAIDEFRRSPGVAGVGVLRQLAIEAADGTAFPVAGQLDGTFGSEVDRARVIDGRVPDQSKADEIAIGENLAASLDLRVGDPFEVVAYSPEDVQSEMPGDPSGPRLTLRVVGIVRRPLDLGGRGALGGVVVPTRAFTETYRDEIGSWIGTVLRVRADEGAADVARVGRTARRIFGDDERFSLTGLAVEGAVARNAIDVATVGLWVAAGVAVAASVAAIGLTLSRVLSLADADQAALRALGAVRWVRAAAAGSLALPAALVGALLAVAGAVLASGWFPIGVAESAEPDPGLRVDAAALGVGLVVVVAVVVALAVVAAVRTSRAEPREAPRTRPPIGARVASRAGTPPPAAVGIRFALDRPGGAGAVATRTALAGAVLGVLVVVAALVFSASLGHLVSTPAAYGWTWDLQVGDRDATPTPGDDCGPVTTRLTRVEGLTSITNVCLAAVEVDGRPVPGWAYRRVSGTPVGPAIVDGRRPTTATEIALGRDTLDGLDKEIGDRVRVAGTERTRTFRVVGTSAFPIVEDTQALAEGAVFTPAGIRRTGPAHEGWNLVARYAPDADRASVDAAVRGLAGPFPGDEAPDEAIVPTEVEHVRSIEGLPIALAAFVATIAMFAIGVALVTAARRRRHELAVLKTVGFVGRQVRAVSAWQASTVGVVGLIVGVPLGLVVGRLAWGAVADDLGVSPAPTWPVVAIVLLACAVLAVLNVVAAVPARVAARTRPAVVLRSE